MDFSQYQRLEFRRKFFKILGAEIDITNPDTNELVAFIQMKAWKLREDVRIYRDKTKTQELFSIHARNIIDIGATYDVIDSASGQPLFYMRRKGLRSAFVRDHWDIFTPADQPIGSVQETSGGLAILRRYVGIIPYVGEIVDLILGFVPQTYKIMDAAGNVSADVEHRKNPFIVKIGLDRSKATINLDPRINVAAVALLSIIDASKN